MYTRFSTLLSVAALAVVAAAAPSELEARNGKQCNTGKLECCNQTFQPNDPALATILAGLGVVLGPVTGLVGLDCSEITVVGGGTSGCSATTVCCGGNTDNGVVNFDCVVVQL